jgi:multisubunit Na+/H+ antiporter MnhE subunit
MGGLLRVWMTWWVLLAAMYLLLADSVVPLELVAGTVAAAVGATGAALVHRERRVRLRGNPRWLWAAGRPLAGLVGDVWPLARVLVARGVLRRAGAGVLVEIPFAATSDGPEDTARRAVTEVLGTLGPNTIVVRIDRERGVVVAHQLLATSDAGARATPLPG